MMWRWARINQIKMALLAFFGQTFTNSCHRSEDRFSQTSQELASTAELAAVPTPDHKTISRTLNLFVTSFSSYQKDTLIPAIPNIYAHNAFLNDRIAEVKGRDQIRQYFSETFEKIDSAHFQILDVSYGKKDIYLRWDMEIRLQNSKDSYTFAGMSQLRFDREGKILLHLDHWDYSQLLEKFPVVGPIIRSIRGSSD